MTLAPTHDARQDLRAARHAVPATTRVGSGTAAGEVRAAVARPIADLLDGPVRAAGVLGVFPAVAYLVVGRDRVVAVTSRDGIVLPCALVLPRDVAAGTLAGVARAGRAWIGDGRLHLGGLTIVGGRTFEPRPALALGASHPARLVDGIDRARRALARHAPAPDGELGRRVGAWERACHHADRDAQRNAADALLGYGAGLTPSGDDVLAGTLAAAALLDGAASATLARTGAEIVRRAGDRTPTLSAALLRHATRGELAGPAATLLETLVGPQGPIGDGAIPAAVRSLLTVGHTSGRDLAVGLLLGAGLAAGD